MCRGPCIHGLVLDKNRFLLSELSATTELIGAHAVTWYELIVQPSIDYHGYLYCQPGLSRSGSLG